MSRTALGPGSKKVAAGLAASLLLTSLVARAWTQGANFETHIHGHEFSNVTLESNACQVKVRLLFQAPAAAYKNDIPGRNFYRFHARIKLDDGRAIETRVFSNSAPGARAYSYSLDSTADACWAKTEHKIQRIDIEGCRGAGCTPDPFQ